MTQNFSRSLNLAPLISVEMEADHGDDADDTPECQQYQAPPIVLTSQVNLIQMRKQLKDLLRGNFEFRNNRNGTRAVTKVMADFQQSALASRSISSHASPSVPNPRSL
jgi:hypothetical protein